MYHYTISRKASNPMFLDICNSFEGVFHECQKDKIMIDVDGTCIQIYYVNGFKVTIWNDFEVDAVYVDSEIELPEDVVGKYDERNKNKHVLCRRARAPRLLEEEGEKLIDAFCEIDPEGEWNDVEWEEYLEKHASQLLKDYLKYCSRHLDECELCDWDGNALRDENGKVIQEWSIAPDHSIVDEQGKRLFYSNGEPIMAKQMSDELFAFLKEEWGITEECRWY